MTVRIMTMMTTMTTMTTKTTTKTTTTIRNKCAPRIFHWRMGCWTWGYIFYIWF